MPAICCCDIDGTGPDIIDEGPIIGPFMPFMEPFIDGLAMPILFGAMPFMGPFIAGPIMPIGIGCIIPDEGGAPIIAVEAIAGGGCERTGAEVTGANWCVDICGGGGDDFMGGGGADLPAPSCIVKSGMFA